MDQRIINNALVFLSRVDLKGHEALEYVNVVNAIRKLEDSHTLADHLKPVSKEEK
jgi:hypothetical protein